MTRFSDRGAPFSFDEVPPCRDGHGGACGYACDSGANAGGGWTVLECVDGDGGFERWQSDGACR